MQRQLYTAIPDGWGVYQTLGIGIPLRRGLFIPDLVIADAKLLSGNQSHIQAADTELVVEITSPSSLRKDRITKPAALAAAAVPLYLLIDKFAPGGPTVTLYSDPSPAVYRKHIAVRFGDPVPLPEPFGITLETGGFPADS